MISADSICRILSFGLFAIAVIAIAAGESLAQELKNAIPRNQKPILKLFPPAPGEQSKAGTGKFVIFTREQVGKDWDFIAGAWECNPSQPDMPITKRAEFCHSSWNASPLLNTLVRDGSHGMHPRFVKLQVDSDDRYYNVNLYDINYRTWDVQCLWQGGRLSAFGIHGDSIFCETTDHWQIINVQSGKIRREVPFMPLAMDGDFWLVRKPGESDGCWSYDLKKSAYVAQFNDVDRKMKHFESKLSVDGKYLVSVLATVPVDWKEESLKGKLVLQRHGEKDDIDVPVVFPAIAGSGIPVIPIYSLGYRTDGTLLFRAATDRKATTDRVWTVEIATGKVTMEDMAQLKRKDHIESDDRNETAEIDGVPVPDYLRQKVRDYQHFGRGGLAPAFFIHMGILTEKPEYPDCTAGVSRDGRHVLYMAKKGPLAGEIIYGDMTTKKTIRWKTPAGFDGHSSEFAWVVTP